MGGLQGRAISRIGGNGGSRFSPAAAEPPDVVKRAADILKPLLIETLFPQQFTGDVGISLHIHAGFTNVIKEFRCSKTVPGLVTKKVASGGSLDNVLESSIADLGRELQSLTPDFYGTITLSLQIDRGTCTMVLCTRDRAHKQQ